MINRRAVDRAIERLQLLPNLFKIKKEVDLAKQMTGRDMIVETEVVKETRR